MPTRGERSPDYYEILQVSPHATTEVIHAAYRALARIYHPDINTSPATPEIMRRVNFAYETLKDPTRRAAYNVKRARSMADHRVAAATPGRALRSRPTPSPAAGRSSTEASELRVPATRARLAIAAVIATIVLLIVLASVWALVQLSDDSPTLARFEVAVGDVEFNPAAEADVFTTQPFARGTQARGTRSSRP
jgi:curved DNA-binding protein CbpA